MNRLLHSRKAFRRSLQISRARANIFVEGRAADPFFYGGIVAKQFSSRMDYRLIKSDEIDGPQTGGKHKLLEVFEWLRRRHELVLTFKGASSTAIFYLDKDIDDLTRRLKRSPHVVYTRAYDVEGEIFREGDIGLALAATCSLAHVDVESKVAAGRDYRELAMLSWQEWVVYCVAAQLANDVSVAGFGSRSKLHQPDAITADIRSARAHHSSFVGACTTKGESPEQLLKRAQRKVDAAYANDGGYSVFKGKWFGEVIGELAAQDFPLEVRRIKAFPHRLTGQVAQSLDFSAGWTAHYADPLAKILAAL